MVNQGADIPEVADSPAPESQGLLDLTPQGQDSADITSVVDEAQAAETTAPVANSKLTSTNRNCRPGDICLNRQLNWQNNRVSHYNRNNSWNNRLKITSCLKKDKGMLLCNLQRRITLDLMT